MLGINCRVLVAGGCRDVMWDVRIFNSFKTSPNTPLCSQTGIREAETCFRVAATRCRRGDAVGMWLDLHSWKQGTPLKTL